MAKITFVFHLDGVSLIDDGTTIRRALSLSDGNLLVSSFIAFYGDKDEEPSDQTVRCARPEQDAKRLRRLGDVKQTLGLVRPL